MHYEEALRAHVSAHLAALAAGDLDEMIRGLTCQADTYQALGRYSEAIAVIEEALRSLQAVEREEQRQTKAHLLACWADNAMMMQDHMTAQRKLEASAALLDRSSPHEEFDWASWYQFAGKCAFLAGNYRVAIEHFDASLRLLSSHSLVRRVLSLLPLLVAHAWQQERDACITTAETALSVIRTLNAPVINGLFQESLRGLPKAFPKDHTVEAFVLLAQSQLLHTPTTH